MNDKLAKIFSDFCKVKDQLNTGNVNEKTVDIIGRFGKAVKSAETIVLDPPKVDRSFQAEFKIENFIPLSQEEVKAIELKLKEPKNETTSTGVTEKVSVKRRRRNKK